MSMRRLTDLPDTRPPSPYSPPHPAAAGPLRPDYRCQCFAVMAPWLQMWAVCMMLRYAMLEEGLNEHHSHLK